MTLDEFNKAIEQAVVDCENQKKKLLIQFCKANAKFKVGDIIEDHSERIKVEKIMSSWGFGDPQPCYEGVVLRKSDNTPKQSGHKRTVYQNNVVKIF